MTRPAVAFGDAASDVERLVRQMLDEESATDPERPSYTVVGQLPGAKSDLLVVVLGEDWVEWSLSTAVQIVRVVVWDQNYDQGWDTAGRLKARLLAYNAPGGIHSIRHETGPRKGRDPNYNTPIVATTLRVRMRPAVV